MLSPGISSIIERSAFPLHCRHTHKKRISLLSLSKRPETLLVFRVLFGLDLLFPSCFRRVNSQHSMDAFQGKKKVGTTTKMRPSLTSGMTSWRSSTGGGRSGPTPGCFGGDFIVHSLGGGGVPSPSPSRACYPVVVVTSQQCNLSCSLWRTGPKKTHPTVNDAAFLP